MNIFYYPPLYTEAIGSATDVMISRDIVLVPYWIAQGLARNQRNLSDCTDIGVMQSIFSTQDLAGFIALNQDPKLLFGFDPGLSFGFGISGLWYSRAMQGQLQEQLAFLDTTLTPLASDPNILKSVCERLFNHNRDLCPSNAPFEKCDLGATASGVIIYPGYFNQIFDKALQFQLIETVLEVLYVYLPHSSVAKTPLAGKYLQLLAEKSNSVF